VGGRTEAVVPAKHTSSETPAKPSQLAAILGSDPDLSRRHRNVIREAVQVRASEYHLTNACNIRCRECWFFSGGHQTATREVKDLATWDRFLTREVKQRRINSALVIGGEPTLFLDRLRLIKRHMRYLTVSTNGLVKLPRDGFEDTAVAVTLFGGGPLDDALRGYSPGGKCLTGLFEQSLENYENDDRVGFVYAVAEDGIQYIEDTVRRIAANGNYVTFNYYCNYNTGTVRDQGRQNELLAELLAMQKKYPETVTSHPYFIRTLITGESASVKFGYDVCPSINVDHPDNKERRNNGNPALPVFNTYTADLKTVALCCTSGICDVCRDSQAIQSWLLVNRNSFLDNREQLRIWIELAESYWAQFPWTRYHPRNRNTIGTTKQRVIATVQPEVDTGSLQLVRT